MSITNGKVREITTVDVLDAACRRYDKDGKSVRLAPLPNKAEQDVYTVAVRPKNLPAKDEEVKLAELDYKEVARGTLNELYNWLTAE